MHTAIEKKAYDSIILDLSNCTSAFQSSMLSFCAQVMAYTKSGINFELILPKRKQLANLFINTNWAHLLVPRQYSPSRFRGHSRIPATQYQSGKEQNESVNKIVNVILGAIPDMQRKDFGAFEWAINELTDNVLIHSESSIGGLVQVSTFSRNSKQVQFVVADAGIGIPKSLREGHSDISSDTEALDWAIREGVTRDKSIGQGNGLFGSYQICSKCNGTFSVVSGHAKLEHKNNKFTIKDEHIPYAGTLVAATIDFSEPGLLEEALQLKGRKHVPVNYVETKYETTESGDILFTMIDECVSFGSRVSGKPVRTKLSNLASMGGSVKINIDLEGVPIMSSSFADEVFGKLFLEIGAITFTQKFHFINMMETVEQLINKAISQRMLVGTKD